MINEYDLILKAVLLNKTSNEIDAINNLLEKKLDWIEISGQLINHRLSGYFYCGLKNFNLDNMPGEVYRGLELIVNAQKNDMQEKIHTIMPILEALEETTIKYAGLKGIVLFADYYDFGIRRSNDIDLLVHEEDLETFDKIVRRFGYIQSNPHNNEIIEASKKEKLIQRLNYHDLIPYIKETKNMISNIDVNFLFDSNKNIIEKDVFDLGTKMYEGNGYKIRGLQLYTNLAHLCAHFHREATNFIWTSVNVDMTLYKLVDIMNFIRVHNEELVLSEWIQIVKRLNLQNQCYYTFYVLTQFFTHKFIEYCERALRPNDVEFVTQINVNAENKIIRNKGFVETAFTHHKI